MNVESGNVLYSWKVNTSNNLVSILADWLLANPKDGLLKRTSFLESITSFETNLVKNGESVFSSLITIFPFAPLADSKSTGE